ncbi:hypothetical protein Dimus_000777 [Dionaea muscipula]
MTFMRKDLDSGGEIWLVLMGFVTGDWPGVDVPDDGITCVLLRMWFAGDGKSSFSCVTDRVDGFIQAIDSDDSVCWCGQAALLIGWG